MAQTKRIHTLDEIRGFCVFCMVFDHALFTLGYTFGGEFARNAFDFFTFISPAFAATFIMICGISCYLSHSNLRRGIKILAAALVITVATLIVTPDAPIVFGILHLLGTSVLLYIPLRKLLDKIPAGLGIALSAVLFFLTYSVSDGKLGTEPLTIELPAVLYESGYLMVLGFRKLSSAYSDYFPLLPWIFAFFSGCFLGRFAREEKFPEFMYKPRVSFFSMLGKSAFLVYIAHQPIAYGVFYLLSPLTDKT